MSQSSLLYLYAFVPSGEYRENPPAELTGMDKESPVEYLEIDEITAVTSQVDPEEFSEANLAKNTENMGWLQEKAFHHHTMMNELHRSFTVVPLKFGTIYENRTNLEEIIKDNQENIVSLFKELEGKEEWNVKIYAEESHFQDTAMKDNEALEKKKQEIAQLPKGRQFFEKKKIDQFLQEQTRIEIENACRHVDEQLKEQSEKWELKKNWEKKVTGKNEEMYWNSAYLIPKSKVEAFLAIIKQKQEEASREENGLVYEATGPWPAYHFSNFLDRGVKNGT